MSQEYLFICGCPRSGTTALVRLLNSHQSLAIGMERYKYYANRKNIDKINSSSFNTDFFFNIKDDQTNIQWKYFYDELKDKYKFKVKYLGDKYPHYYRFYNQINKNLGKVKWIFIVRNVTSIAKSYNARAADANDSWSEEANFIKAVDHWNESLIETWKYQKSHPEPNLFVCEYEKLFGYDLEYLNSILDFLEVKLESNIKAYFEEMKADWLSKQMSGSCDSNTLSKKQLNYIEINAKYTLKDNLLKKFD
ncbi:MAG: sulfotransferase [Pleurocapsa sp.]